MTVDLVRHGLIMKQAPTPDSDLAEIVDEVFLPLVRTAANAPGPERSTGR